MKSQRVWKGDVGDRLSVSIVVNKQKLGDHVGPEVSVSYRGVCIAQKRLRLNFYPFVAVGDIFQKKKFPKNTKRYLAVRFFVIQKHMDISRNHFFATNALLEYF